jgi:hypothetical protein
VVLFFYPKRSDDMKYKIKNKEEVVKAQQYDPKGLLAKANILIDTGITKFKLHRGDWIVEDNVYIYVVRNEDFYKFYEMVK